MNALEDYILNEFKDTQTEFAARNINYSFNSIVSNKGVNDVITMNIKIYDDNMNLLDSKAIKFINYKLAKPCEKKLVNIDVNELNNLFMKALDDIKNEIAKEYNAKINEFKAKLECLCLKNVRNGLSDLMTSAEVLSPNGQTASSYEHEKDKFARTIPGKWNGDVKQIIEYYPKTNKYKVEFEVPGEKTYIDIIPASYLRGSIPTKMSDLEREFFAKETP